MNEYNPKLIDLNQEMMRYSIARFNSYYSKLYELAENVNENEQAKADFTGAYGKLQLQVQSIQESMEQRFIRAKNRFKTVLDKDSNNLSIKADEAIKKTLQGSSGDIVKLERY